MKLKLRTTDLNVYLLREDKSRDTTAEMASTTVSMSEDRFLCSICLDIFNKPVKTPCGHNYCEACITGYWATSDSIQCPLCKKEFQQTPVLQVSTEFRDMLELFKNTRRTADVKGSPPGTVEVFCDLCHVKNKALKSCLVCLASYCDCHLKPHYTVSALQWHKLIKPTKSLEDRMCKKHNRVKEFFCKKDQSCTCVMCLRDDHEMHEAVSIEEEVKARKNQLKNMEGQVKQTLNETQNMIQEIQNSVKHGQKELKKTVAETAKAFDALVAMIVTKKLTLIQLLEGKQKAAQQRAEDIIRRLQLQIAENSQMITKLEELSNTEDDFRLLEGFTSMSSPSNIKHPYKERPQSLLQMETLRSGMSQIEKTLNKQIENITREVNKADKEEMTDKVFEDELGNIQKQFAINVALDPDSAHPCLILSEDRKEVKDGGTKRNAADIPTRFDSLHIVLGDEGFSSGKFYYQVQLEGQTCWEIGVVRESICRKGLGLSLTPENGCWTLGSYWGRCQANANPPVILSLAKVPEQVGVFVDYERGFVSFYDVDARALIYTFTGCSFTAIDSFLRNMWSFRVYRSTPAKTKLYPLFRPSAEDGNNSNPLKITPVHAP